MKFLKETDYIPYPGKRGDIIICSSWKYLLNLCIYKNNLFSNQILTSEFLICWIQIVWLMEYVKIVFSIMSMCNYIAAYDINLKILKSKVYSICVN